MGTSTQALSSTPAPRKETSASSSYLSAVDSIEVTSTASSSSVDSIEAINEAMEEVAASMNAMEEDTQSMLGEPAFVSKKKIVTKKKAKNPAHKEGVFSPIVVAAKDVMGDKTLNSVRGDFIALHSNIIKKFVATYDTPTGQRAIKNMFALADINGDGKLDKEEMALALQKLGFTWLKQKQTDGIFKRADKDGDGFVDFEEFAAEVPNTLKTNLVKLAKKNGGDMGLLV